MCQHSRTSRRPWRSPWMSKGRKSSRRCQKCHKGKGHGPQLVKNIFEERLLLNFHRLLGHYPSVSYITVGNPCYFYFTFSLLHGLIWNFSLIKFCEKFLLTFYSELLAYWFFTFFDEYLISSKWHLFHAGEGPFSSSRFIKKN